MTDNTSFCLTTDVISAAIADQVRRLGGDSEAIRNISFAASYAVICWSLAAAERSQSIPRRPEETHNNRSNSGKDTTWAA